MQLNFHLKIVNPTFAAMVEVLPPFEIGMAQALHNTANWKRMADGEEPVAVHDLPVGVSAPSSGATAGTNGATSQ